MSFEPLNYYKKVTFELCDKLELVECLLLNRVAKQSDKLKFVGHVSSIRLDNIRLKWLNFAAR
jgi:hypothetical protein